MAFRAFSIVVCFTLAILLLLALVLPVSPAMIKRTCPQTTRCGKGISNGAYDELVNGPCGET
jgi:hypothetical protein